MEGWRVSQICYVTVGGWAEVTVTDRYNRGRWSKKRQIKRYITVERSPQV